MKINQHITFSTLEHATFPPIIENDHEEMMIVIFCGPSQTDLVYLTFFQSFTQNTLHGENLLTHGRTLYNTLMPSRHHHPHHLWIWWSVKATTTELFAADVEIGWPERSSKVQSLDLAFESYRICTRNAPPRCTNPCIQNGHWPYIVVASHTTRRSEGAARA